MKSGVLVRVSIAQAIGWGEVAPTPDSTDNPIVLAQEVLRVTAGLPLVDANFLERLDERSPSSRIRCGIATAWLSAQASTEGHTLSSYLGRGWRIPRTHVPVNATIGAVNAATARSEALRYRDAGFTTLKLKCTSHFEDDMRRIEAVCEAHPRARLRLDPNGAWAGPHLLEYLNEVTRFPVEYVEEPLSGEVSLEVFSSIARQSPVPLALDHWSGNPKDIASISHARAAHTLIVKSQIAGGPDKVMSIIREAALVALPLVISVSLETVIGITAAVHCAALLSDPAPCSGLVYWHFYERQVADPPSVRQGFVEVPSDVGLGTRNFSFDSLTALT